MNKDFLCKLREEGKLELSDPVKLLRSMEMLYSMGYVFNGAEWVKGIVPRTKVVHEKIDFNSVIDVIRYLDAGKWLYTNEDSEDRIDRYCAGQWKVEDLEKKDFYRKVEKEIDWKDELSFFFGSLDYGVVERNEYHQGEIGISMEINEIDFISMCHLVASLTDKPE